MSHRPHRLLFICSGNICRSPMAEGLAREIGEQTNTWVESDSAGTLNLVGREAASNAQAVMREVGFIIDDHRSKGISDELVDWADRILVMTYDHASFLHEHYPHLGLKVELLGPYGGRNPEIADPIGGWKRRFRKSRDEIAGCVQGLLDRLEPAGLPSEDDLSPPQ